MKILVTGSSGHLGEAIVRLLRERGDEVVGLDVKPSAFTALTGSITDRAFADRSVAGADAVIHAATLHKPHVATHSRQDFVDTNITGTLNLLEAAAANGVGAFVFTSTTSVFGDALVPGPGEPAVWITEDVAPQPKNIYGITKLAAEELCRLFHRKSGLPCTVLRTSRFFPEEDDNAQMRAAYTDDNAKANEFLFRRVDVGDAARAHLLALDKAAQIGFSRYIISATSPFEKCDLEDLRREAPAVAARHFPQYVAEYAKRRWKMFPEIGRVYVNEKARTALGWLPEHDFGSVIDRLAADQSVLSDLATAIGRKGYHDTVFDEGPYPVE